MPVYVILVLACLPFFDKYFWTVQEKKNIFINKINNEKTNNLIILNIDLH